MPRKEKSTPAPLGKSEAKPVVTSVSDLARYLGLSDWTVSRAINNYPAVKASTRERVHKAMKEVGFRPNPIARGLRGKGTGLVGVCFNELRNTILIEKLATFEEFLHSHGFRSILSFTGQDIAGEINAIKDFRNLRVDAIVQVQSQMKPAQAKEVLADSKWVQVDPAHPELTPSVQVDRKLGTLLLIDHLVELGHRRFGLLGIAAGDNWRWPGLLAGLKRHGLDPATCMTLYPFQSGLYASYEMGGMLAEAVLADRNPPRALIAMNDRVAIAAIQRLRHAGARIPKDFSVTGFDNLDIAHHLFPTLTTIDQQPALLMKTGGDLLLQQLRPGKTKLPEKCLVAPVLRVGQSTGPA